MQYDQIKARNYIGNTLVEVLLYVALSATILITISATYLQLLEIKAENRARREIETQAQFLISQLEEELLAASNITLPTSNTTSDQLSLQIPDQTYNTLFLIENGDIAISRNNATPISLTSDLTISSLSFANRTSGESITVDYTFTLQHPYFENSYNSTYTGTINLRR